MGLQRTGNGAPNVIIIFHKKCGNPLGPEMLKNKTIFEVVKGQFKIYITRMF
jgi:hypothetical protein